MKTILLIDDDREYTEVAAYALTFAGYSVTETPCPTSAFEILETSCFDLILCDLHMPFCSQDKDGHFVTSYEVGYRTAKELSDIFGPGTVALLSHLSQSDLMRLSPFVQHIPLFTKPNNIADLVLIVRELFGRDERSGIALQ